AYLAAVSWRVLVVAAALLALVLLVARMRVVLVPAAIAVIVACALWPLTRRLRAGGASPALAALLTVGALLAGVALVVWLVAPHTADELRELDVSVTGGVGVVERWLTTGPLGLSPAEVESFFDNIEQQVRGAGARAASGAIGGAMLAVETVASALLALVLLFFFLKDGDQMWQWLSSHLPRRQTALWDEVAVDVRDVLSSYLRGTTLVAAVDAVGIGVGLALLGVPLVIPLALLTFVGGYVPLIGATVAGFVAVMVALVSNGFLTALAVLGVVIGVQQLEGNVLQPMLVGRMVQLHPAVILIVVSAGAVLWGIPVALLAVPVTAALSVALARMRAASRDDAVPGITPVDVDVVGGEEVGADDLRAATQP
ncbi:MAG: AI-2E family transporter, partial [Gaiella sp.]